MRVDRKLHHPFDSPGAGGLAEATLETGETVEIGAEDIALEDEVGELALPFNADEAGGCKFLHVVGEGGGANGLRFRDAGAGRGALTAADLGENFIAAGCRERTGDEGKLPVGEADLLCGAGAFFGHGFLPYPRRWMFAGEI